MTAPTDWLPLLEEIADGADATALHWFRHPELRVTEKSDLSPVSEADEAIERLARDIIARTHPQLGILGEEQGETSPASAARLIIDPIDATRNFVRGIPVFATLLAIEVDGEIEAGVVSAPALGRRWRAARGAGAWAGDCRMMVSTVSTVEDAQLFHGNLRARSEGAEPPGLESLMGRVERTRGFGDFYQHALVAEGAGEIAVDPLMFAWDVAPLLVIVEEAGGRATTLEGERTIYGGSLITTNGIMHDEVLRSLRDSGAS
jgi:histidinol-phosphatase